MSLSFSTSSVSVPSLLSLSFLTLSLSFPLSLFSPCLFPFIISLCHFLTFLAFSISLCKLSSVWILPLSPSLFLSLSTSIFFFSLPLLSRPTSFGVKDVVYFAASSSRTFKPSPIGPYWKKRGFSPFFLELNWADEMCNDFFLHFGILPRLRKSVFQPSSFCRSPLFKTVKLHGRN